MRKEKALITMLTGLVDLISDEAARNPEFAERVGSILAPLPKKWAPAKKRRAKSQTEKLPDIHEEWQARGEPEFRLWLRDQPLEVLRGLIRRNDLDASRRTSKWNDPEKLSGFIADQLRARLSRGSTFLRSDG